MNLFQVLQDGPPLRAVAWCGDRSLRKLDTGFCQRQERAMEGKLLLSAEAGTT